MATEQAGEGEHPFTTAVRSVGYNKIASKSGVSYQTVSKMAADPRPGTKFHMRRRIAVVAIEEVTERKQQLIDELEQSDSLLAKLTSWVETDFVKGEGKEAK